MSYSCVSSLHLPQDCDYAFCPTKQSLRFATLNTSLYTREAWICEHFNLVESVRSIRNFSFFIIHFSLAHKGAVNGGSKPPPYRYDNAQPVGTGLASVLICYISHCEQPQGLSLRYAINSNPHEPPNITQIKDSFP